jgi:uncharacterized membrane protein YbhN (UPF0104 family)
MASIVFVVFLILRLFGLSEIPWFWVFFPLWIVPAVKAAVLMLIGVEYFIEDSIRWHKLKKEFRKEGILK